MGTTGIHSEHASYSNAYIIGRDWPAYSHCSRLRDTRATHARQRKLSSVGLHTPQATTQAFLAWDTNTHSGGVLGKAPAWERGPGFPYFAPANAKKRARLCRGAVAPDHDTSSCS